jgi:hypothetical protein
MIMYLPTAMMAAEVFFISLCVESAGARLLLVLLGFAANLELLHMLGGL